MLLVLLHQNLRQIGPANNSLAFVVTHLWYQTGGMYCPILEYPTHLAPATKAFSFHTALCSPCTSHAVQLWRSSVMCDVTSGFSPLLTVYCLLTSTMRLCSALACCQGQPHDGSQKLFYLSSPLYTLSLSFFLSVFLFSLSLSCGGLIFISSRENTCSGDQTWVIMLFANRYKLLLLSA